MDKLSKDYLEQTSGCIFADLYCSGNFTMHIYGVLAAVLHDIPRL